MTTREYNQIVEEYADKVFRYVVKTIRDRERAHDLVQDSFEKLWRNKDLIGFDKAKSYLFSIAHNTMIDMIRKENRQIVTETERLPQGSHSEHYSDLKEILDEAVGKLPEIQRSVVLLRDYEGYSYQEIGDITGLSESQVKVYIYRARVFLKNYIGELQTVI
jgi:RNA polymerase sigma-70 factor (ECF subfamily)